MTGGKAFEWKVALILFGVLFLGVSDTQLVPPLLSSIANEFQTSAGHTGIIVTSYSLAAAVFALFAGPLSDRIGRKKVLVGGLALFTVASFSTQHVTTLGALVAARTLTGFAAGTLSTCALSFAGDHYSYQQRGRAMGVLSMAYFLAFVVSAPAGALLRHAVDEANCRLFHAAENALGFAAQKRVKQQRGNRDAHARRCRHERLRNTGR